MKSALKILVGALIFTSCAKEDELLNSNEAIKIGYRSKNLIVENQDSLTIDFKKKWHYLDVDKDGKRDIVIRYSLQNITGKGNYSYTTINIPNDDLSFLGVKYTDSIFKTFKKGITTVSPGLWNERNDYLTYSCERLENFTEFDRVNTYAVAKDLLEGAVVKQTDFTEKAYGIQTAYYPPPKQLNEADTVVILHSTNPNADCHSFPKEKDVYIAFQLTQDLGKMPKLGWIKLNISDESVIIFETAIQK